jgi:hypothetical protein
MKRIFFMSVATMAFASTAWADVYIRVPFVRVQVGGSGTHVRAPFVNIFSPRSERVVVMPEADAPPAFTPPAPEALPQPSKKAPITDPASKPTPAPQPKTDQAEPAPAGLQQVLTLDQFVDGFQPKAGNYEVTFLNPVSRKATTVQFSLPEGTPRRVHASSNQIEFDYGARKYVRIRFDRDGAEVTSR